MCQHSNAGLCGGSSSSAAAGGLVGASSLLIGGSLGAALTPRAPVLHGSNACIDGFGAALQASSLAIASNGCEELPRSGGGAPFGAMLGLGESPTAAEQALPTNTATAFTRSNIAKQLSVLFDENGGSSAQNLQLLADGVDGLDLNGAAEIAPPLAWDTKLGEQPASGTVWGEGHMG